MALTFSFDMQTVLHPESYLSIILQGFKKVYNVSGGIHAYAVKADSSVPTYQGDCCRINLGLGLLKKTRGWRLLMSNQKQRAVLGFGHGFDPRPMVEVRAQFSFSGTPIIIYGYSFVLCQSQNPFWGKCIRLFFFYARERERKKKGVLENCLLYELRVILIFLVK